MKLALDDLKLGAGTQPRAKIDEAVVADYAEAMSAGAAFPPVVVFFDGEIYYLADGFHRVDAAYRLGLSDIEAEVKQGTHRDAIYYSLGANADHGLRRTAEDKRRAVLRMLEDKDWKSWPQGEIAKACRVSREFVNRVAAELNPMCDRSHIERKDGKPYTIPQRTTRIPSPIVNEMPLDEDEPATRPKPEAPAPFEPPTPPEAAIRDLRDYIDVILDEIDSDQARHFVVNETIKYLREKAIAYNKSA